MNESSYSVLRFILVLALAVAPLRMAFSLPFIATDASESHCQTMQQETSLHDHRFHPQAALDQAADSNCLSGCSGACCEGSCGTCAHGSATLVVNSLSFPEIRLLSVNMRDVQTVVGYRLYPPFRPPILS